MASFQTQVANLGQVNMQSRTYLYINKVEQNDLNRCGKYIHKLHYTLISMLVPFVLFLSTNKDVNSFKTQFANFQPK